MHLRSGANLYEKVAALLAGRDARRVLDLGCGEGALAAAVRRLSGDAEPLIVGLDASANMLSAAPPPVVLADATAIPFRDNVFDAVVAINVLDHLPDPRAALRAAHRVLRSGGVVIAGAISRHDSPELAPVWRPEPTPFDAEDAPDGNCNTIADVPLQMRSLVSTCRAIRSGTIVASLTLVAKESAVDLPQTLHGQLYLVAYDPQHHRFRFERDNRCDNGWLFGFA